MMRCRICVNDHNPDFESKQFENAREFADHIHEIHDDTPAKDFYQEWFEQVSEQRKAIIDKARFYSLKAENHDKAREFIAAHHDRELSKILNNILLED